MGLVIVLTGVYAVITRRAGLAVSCYLMIPVIQVFNKALVGMGPMLFLTGRFGGPVIIIVLIVSGEAFHRYQCEKLPIGWMWGYLGVAALSSCTGWMPFISYFKIAYFALFIAGLLMFTKFMQITEGSLRFLRTVFMALSMIMIVGSVIVYFIPSVGYSMTIYRMAAWGVDMTGSELAQSDVATYFNGMTCHSQAISPVVMLLATWVLYDMILIVRRVTWLHSGILVCVPILAYMSRSRGALLMLVTIVVMTMFIALPRARVPVVVKRRLRMAISVATFILLAAGIVFQVQNNTISKWLRKTDNVAGDTRTLGEAFTGSRKALVDMNLDDFHQNPLLGMGFQVSRWMRDDAKQSGYNWFTASVEKGVTPYVILGETGCVGAVVFLIFLGVFYSCCATRKYMALMTSFTVVLVANLADSSLFSPSYQGGFMWLSSCIGCFALDIMARRYDRFEDAARQDPRLYI